MATEPNRCPNCGAERPADAQEGVCPNCVVDPDATADVPGLIRPPEPTAEDPDATGAHAGTPAGPMSTVPIDPDATTDGDGNALALPGGTHVHYFGDYDLQKELGRGGMGIVYKARQVSLNRPVALKMIKAGVLADEVELRRFQNEAEAVALLDHPGIVPVYEVGEHDGQRYFSMKLVEGGNLADRLASLGADPRASATLLAEAADAVHHAHMRGILHRDLKPANILVDPEGHPHVTDFGLAKRVEGDVEMTASGAILGTPAYMSPEQARGRRGSITTATDVYGLGAILYAMLSGRAPFGGGSLAETLDAVRTRAPEPPAKLNRNVPRDLDTICLKCLEKDPRRRYASAHELAEDLRNWLGSRPISARRVGSAERAWLWCKRRPAVASLAASVLLAVILGTSTVIAVQARANRDLLAANKKLDAQRDRAEDRETLAIAAIRKFREAIADEPELKNTPAFEALRKRLLREPLAFFRELRDRLQADRDTRPESLARLADACFSLGLLSNEIGDKRDALASYRESLAIRRGMAEPEASTTDRRRDMAITYNNIGVLLGEAGRAAEALEAHRSALAIRETLADADPNSVAIRDELADSHNNIGLILGATGKTADALKAHCSALEIWRNLAERKPDNARFRGDQALSLVNIAGLLQKTGKTAGAVEAYRSALEILRKLADENPKIDRFRNELATVYGNMSNLLDAIGKPAEALESIESALVIRRKLAEDRPSVTEYRSDLAAATNNLGNRLKGAGRLAEALRSYNSGLAILKKLADDHPTVPEFRRNLAAAHFNLGSLLGATGKTADALKAHRSALDLRRKLADDQPEIVQYRSDLADSSTSIGFLLLEAGSQPEAVTYFESALAIGRNLAKDHPESPEFASDLGGGLNNLAMLDLDAKRFDVARDRLQEAIASQKKALASNPSNPTYRRYLANHLGMMVEVAQGLGDENGAAEATRELAALRDSDPAMIALDARLAAIGRGEQEARDNPDRLDLARRAYDKGLHAVSARLWADAFDADPGLAEDRKAGHRYNAACSAALAGRGRAKDDPPPDDPARARLRERARAWLEADLVAWSRLVESGPPQARAFIAQTLAHWQEDSDLAGVRDPKALDALPEAERDAWKALWAGVASLSEKVRAAEPKVEK